MEDFRKYLRRYGATRTYKKRICAQISSDRLQPHTNIYFDTSATFNKIKQRILILAPIKRNRKNSITRAQKSVSYSV